MDKLTDRARALRKNMTEAEKRLWRYLRNRQFHGLKFRRQHPIPPYIVDFACLATKVVIELDRGHHALMKGRDEARTAYLASKGFKVIRYWNNDVLQNTEGVLSDLARQMRL